MLNGIPNTRRQRRANGLAMITSGSGIHPTPDILIMGRPTKANRSTQPVAMRHRATIGTGCVTSCLRRTIRRRPPAHSTDSGIASVHRGQRTASGETLKRPPQFYFPQIGCRFALAYEEWKCLLLFAVEGTLRHLAELTVHATVLSSS
jgi:hypothetical protein